MPFDEHIEREIETRQTTRASALDKKQRKKDFKIFYIPETLCWTEVPSTLEIFLRQRVRWARGLFQTLYLHKNILFRPKYGKTGSLAFPYFIFFEFYYSRIYFSL